MRREPCVDLHALQWQGNREGLKEGSMKCCPTSTCHAEGCPMAGPLAWLLYAVLLLE